MVVQLDAIRRDTGIEECNQAGDRIFAPGEGDDDRFVAGEIGRDGGHLTSPPMR